MFKRNDEIPHMLIFGTTGSGKSELAKKEIATILKEHPQDRIYVLTNTPEYRSLVEEFGSVIASEQKVRPDHDSPFWPVNPLDLSFYKLENEIDVKLSMKTDYIAAFFEFAKGKSLTTAEREIIGRAARRLYDPYIESMKDSDDYTVCPEKVPTFEDLYNELIKEDIPEAKSLALMFEIYAKGSHNYLSCHTKPRTADIETNRLVIYNFQEMGTMMTPILILSVLENIWCNNLDPMKNTWIYLEDVSILLQNEASAASLRTYWDCSRMQNITLTGITQDFDSFDEFGRAILNNCKSVIFMRQPKMNIETIKDLYSLDGTEAGLIESLPGQKPGNGVYINGRNVEAIETYNASEDTFATDER